MVAIEMIVYLQPPLWYDFFPKDFSIALLRWQKNVHPILLNLLSTNDNYLVKESLRIVNPVCIFMYYCADVQMMKI